MSKSEDVLRVTSARVTPNCRKLHTANEAGNIAINHLKNNYLKCLEAECNKDAEFEFILTLKRKQ